MKELTFVALALILFASCGQQPQTQEETETKVYDDIVTAMPDNAAVVAENDYVRVLHITLPAGAEQPMHKGNARAIYSLTDYQMEWTEGEETGTKTWSAGDAHWHEAGEHAAKNAGESTAEFIVVERTGSELPACDEEALQNDVNAVAPDFAEVILENESVKVTKVMLSAGEMIPEHSGINRVIYALSDYSIDYTSDKEGNMQKSFTSGEAHWHEACQHSLNNTGESEAQFLVFAMKK